MPLLSLPALSPEMATFLACCLALAAASVLARRRLQDPLARRILQVVQGLTLAMLVAGLVQWLTALPVSYALESVRLALNLSLANIGGVPVTPVTLLSVAVIVLVTWVVSGWVQSAMQRMLLARGIGDPGTVAAIGRLVAYAVMAVGFAIGLETLGIDLGAFFAAGAVFAVGLGFAMQTIAENFVAGVILLVERTIRPGDILEVEGEMVRVKHLGIRSTLARNLEDEEIIIPNAKLVQDTVKNLALSDSLLRVRVAIGVAYRSDLPTVVEALGRAAARVKASPVREPVVLLTGFGASSVDFEVSVWTDDPWTRPDVASALALAAWEELARAGVQVALPRVDVRLDRPFAAGLPGGSTPGGPERDASS